MSQPTPTPATQPDVTTADERPATFRDVFAVREFRAMFAARLVSLLGDQAAAVALAVLLYQRSGSALIAALGYATAYLPWTIGGLLLGPLADRFPPRELMVGCDVARAVLIGLAAVPGMPAAVVALLVLVAAFLAPPFESAYATLQPRVLDGDRYAVALSVSNVVHQGAQLGGFLLGGALVVAITAQGALALNAVTFALSALLLRRSLRRHLASAPVSPDGGASRIRVRALLADGVDGVRVVTADSRRYGPLLLGAVGAAYVIVPEAIAPAYVHELGRGTAAVGVVMAAAAAGTAIGSLAFGRLLGPARRQQLMWPLALLGTLPLLGLAMRPGLVVGVLLFALAGSAGAFQVAANTAFVVAVPEAARGRAFGVAMTVMYGAQAAAIVTAGAVASRVAPHAVIAGAAVAGALALLALRRTVRPGPAQVPAAGTAAVPGQVSTASAA